MSNEVFSFIARTLIGRAFLYDKTPFQENALHNQVNLFILDVCPNPFCATLFEGRVRVYINMR